jgi:hypothetical protein
MPVGPGRLSEPGLQGAQLRVVRVLAQPVGLLCGQAQRVAGLGGTAGQQLGLGQQPERERAELSDSSRVHLGEGGPDPLLAAAQVAAAGLRPPPEKLRGDPPLPEPVLADECRLLCRGVQDPGDLFGNGGCPGFTEQVEVRQTPVKGVYGTDR